MKKMGLIVLLKKRYEFLIFPPKYPFSMIMIRCEGCGSGYFVLS